MLVMKWKQPVMMMLSRLDVLVVGAGPAGLTLTIELARRGISCRLIDKLPVFPGGTRARGIGARTQEIFFDFEILDQLCAYAEPFLPSRIYDRENRIVHEVDPVSNGDPTMLPTPESPYQPSLMISQAFTDAVLRNRLTSFGMTVEQDCQLISLTQDADTVTAEVVHAGKREHIQARYLVGCDGGASVVRKSAGIAFRGEVWDEKNAYLIGNLNVSGLDKGYWHTWTDPTWGYVSLQPMRSAATWLFAATVSSGEQHNGSSRTIETFQNLFEERIDMPDVQLDSLTWHSLYRRRIRVVDRYQSGRVMLAGDAAHMEQEQGMNISIQDAYNLGWKLASVLKGASSTLLSTYQEERLPMVEQNLMALVAHARNVSEETSAAVQSITDAILSKESVVDPTQLCVTYRGSKLSCDLDDRTGLRAGDRAPDAPCLSAANGESVRLFEIFRGTHFTLLAFSNDQPVPQLPGAFHHILRTYRVTRSGTVLPDQQTLVDRDGNASRAYGIAEKTAMILVRPDGYIGLTGGNVSSEPIIAYLQRVLGL